MQLLVGVSFVVVACTFPDVATDGVDTSTTSTSSSPQTTTTGTVDPTTTADGSTSSTSTGDGGAPATTSSAGGTSSEGGGGRGGGGSTGSVGGGGAGGSSTQSTGSAGGNGGADSCFDGCELVYDWRADGCTGYTAPQCPSSTFEGASPPACGQVGSLRNCEPQGTIIQSCQPVGNSMSVVATCKPAE